MDPNTQTQPNTDAGQNEMDGGIFGADLSEQTRESQQPTPDAGQQAQSTTPPTESQQPAQPTETPAQQIQQLTPEAIAAAVKAAIQPAQQAPQQAPQMTPEQYQQVMREQFQVYEPTQQDYDTIMAGGESAVKKLNDLLQANLRSAALMAQFTTKKAVQELQQQMQPLVQAQQATTRNQLFGEFSQSYPELKDYEPVVTMVANNLKQQGKTFTSKQDAFKFVAATVKQLVKLQPTQQNQPNGAKRTPPTPTAVGGQGVGGRVAATAAPLDGQVTPKMLFGNVEN